MIPEREIPMPDWLRRGLKYAPLAALTAVIAPEIFMVQGTLIGTWQDRLSAGRAVRNRLLLLAARHPGHHRCGYAGLSAAAHRAGLVAGQRRVPTNGRFAAGAAR